MGQGKQKKTVRLIMNFQAHLYMYLAAFYLVLDISWLDPQMNDQSSMLESSLSAQILIQVWASVG